MTPSNRITITLIGAIGVVPLVLLGAIFGALMAVKISADLILMAWTTK